MLDARTTSGVHEAEVARLVQAYAALPPDAPVRLAKRTSNLFRFRDATADATAGLDVSAFGHVLSVDPVTRTARVGGMTTYEDLCDATLPHQLMPLVVPQLKTITLGGAVTGLGIESTSLRNGMPHESVTAAGDPHRRRPRRRRHRRQRARRPVPRLPELLRDARLQPVSHHRARAGPALRAPAPLPVRQRRSLHGSRQPDRRRGQLPRPQGGLPGRDRVRARRAVPHRRRVQRRGPVAQRLHRPADLLPVGPQGQGGLPHHPRLPVALGHRLVLVLTAIRSTETAGQDAVAAPLPALGRVQEAGRPGPPLRPDRRADAEAAPPVP